MMPARIVHGREAEARRLYNLPHEGQSRRRKRHLSYVQSVSLLAFVAGLLAGLMIGLAA